MECKNNVPNNFSHYFYSTDRNLLSGGVVLSRKAYNIIDEPQ